MMLIFNGGGINIINGAVDLDKSFELILNGDVRAIINGEKLGPELITNGDFANWTLDDPDDWLVVEDGDASSNVTEHANGCQMIRNPDLCIITQSGWNPDAGKTYKVVVIIDVLSSDTDIAVLIGGQKSEMASGGVHTFYITTTTSAKIQLYGYNPCDVIINSISAQEVL